MAPAAPMHPLDSLRVEAGPLPDGATAPQVESDADSSLEQTSTYREIVKASALIGGSSLLNVAVGILRTKAVAILLGPAGFGLMSLYGSIADLTRSAAQLGVNSSGVRQIAAAAGTGDAANIALTAIVLRKVSLALGLFGALLLVVSSPLVSIWTFGSADHAGAVALLGAAVFFRVVSEGEGALIQGMRHICDYAKVAFFGALLGALATVALVYALGEAGVVPGLVLAAALAMLVSWHYSRAISIQMRPVAWREVAVESRSLLLLGLAFMASGLLAMGSAYLVRVIVLRHGGLEAAGIYQAAWALGGLYVGFVLQAMGADFYPRLVAAINDHSKANRLVNEQAQVSLLMAGPGVIATLTFASMIVTVFYSQSFASAATTLRWICLGMMLRVVSWPMGFIILAKGVQWLLFGTELAWAIVSVGGAWVFVVHFGLEGAGIAFFCSYAFHGLLLYPVVRRLSGFSWSAKTLKIAIVFLVAIAAVFCSFVFLRQAWAFGLGVVATMLSSAYSILTLLRLMPSARPSVALRGLTGTIRSLSRRRT